MKLVLIVGYWPSSGPPVDAVDQITAAEELGFAIGDGVVVVIKSTEVMLAKS